MKRRLLSGTFAAALAVTAFAGSALAGQPASPGCFGADRAAYIQDVALASDAAPGASEVGQILSDRGATNGDQNRAYKTACGGDAS
jgi:hypothetical protein